MSVERIEREIALLRKWLTGVYVMLLLLLLLVAGFLILSYSYTYTPIAVPIALVALIISFALLGETHKIRK